MMMSSDADRVLRDLGRRAAGLSPADVERVVREGRQAARRAGRALEFNDLVQALGQSKPPLPANVRRRLAIHEAGHLVAHMSLGVGRISAVSIDTTEGGGWVRMERPLEQEATEDFLEKMLVLYLSGRTAEEQILGSAVASSGGSTQSDLAMATRLALDMESKLGFGEEMPLLHYEFQDYSWALLTHKDLARRVHSRLFDAEVEARGLVLRNKREIDLIVEALLIHGTLEGELLKAVIDRLDPISALGAL
ncbi:ATP-dependent Zn protease [Mesorhizobium sp. 1B3]|uniref:ATP-dependent Zn protease n=1 Tax=Mesorhizobium sp. 1B3 TaxID=3243599 RepID=UPI003D95E041